MKTILLLLLILGSSLELSPNEELSECGRSENAKGLDDCKNLKTELIQQTCCYFYGKYKDTNSSEYKTGGACLEARKRDVATGEKKSETQKKIEAGTYWSNGYPPITDITAFQCFDEFSECEKMDPADDENSCFGLHPQLNSEKCCYVESDWVLDGKTETNYKYCLDVKAADVETEEKKQATIKMIESGLYWDSSYGHPTKVDKLICGSTSSSTSLMINLFVLALILFVF